MNFETWFYYLLTILVLTSTPGPSVLFSVSNGLNGGVKKAFFGAFGGTSAITIIMTLSFTGMGVLIMASDIAFNIIKWIGVAYLIYLGVSAILSKDESFLVDGKSSKPQSFRATYFSGFMVGASNPKAILFFTALFPQFVEPTAPLWPQFIALSLTFIAFEMGWLMIYAYFASKALPWLQVKGRAKLLNRITGSLFVTAGAFLATTSRSSS
jgi:threonine/homoserine/homoserine lactone efflux protein